MFFLTKYRQDLFQQCTLIFDPDITKQCTAAKARGRCVFWSPLPNDFRKPQLADKDFHYFAQRTGDRLEGGWRMILTQLARLGQPANQTAAVGIIGIFSDFLFSAVDIELQRGMRSNGRYRR